MTKMYNKEAIEVIIRKEDPYFDEFEEICELLEEHDLGGWFEIMVKDEPNLTYLKEYLENVEGVWDSTAEFAENTVRETLGESIPDLLDNHIDWQSVWDCDLRHDYTVFQGDEGGEVLICRNY